MNKDGKIRAAIIVDRMQIAEWQKEALANASDVLDIALIVSCQNTKSKSHIIKHLLYYIINILCLRTELTRKSRISSPKIPTLEFNCSYSGAWQTIPPSTAAQIQHHGIRLVIKMGMSLLRIEDHLAQFDVISFHHGDPEYYRGRPAGFYEIYNNAKKVGIIVQKLSNELDAGTILALAHAKIYHHSYKKTATSFYKKSKPLLRKAILNYRNGTIFKARKLGRNYRLPSNRVSAIFILKILYRKISRAAYGAFIEKRWNILQIGYDGVGSLSKISTANGRQPNISPEYNFYADPFFSADGKLIRVEALNSKTGRGEIIEIDSKTLILKNKILKGPHYSYPFSIQDSSIEYIIPEVASHSSPYAVTGEEKSTQLKLKGLEGLRIIDGSILKHGSTYYLFGCLAESASDLLQLYISENLLGPYTPHPQNPIVLDPESARMAGKVIAIDGQLLRFGQNNCHNYGSSITVLEITELTREHYAERKVGTIEIVDARGPHTLDIHKERVVVDYYIDKFSLLAGYRRFVAAIAKK